MRFKQQGRRLRYVDGEAEHCRRKHDFSRRAEAAGRNGCVLNNAPFLPSASQRTETLNVMVNHLKSQKPMKLGRTGNASQSSRRIWC